MICIFQAVRFLHESGVLLHYPDVKSKLSKLFFLEPEWLCSLMAQIITVPEVNPLIDKQGVSPLLLLSKFAQPIFCLFDEYILLVCSPQLLQVSHIPHLLKEPKFPSQFIPEYIRLLERFEVVLSQTPQTLLIPSRLPRVKPSSVTLPPASPGCEMMSSFISRCVLHLLPISLTSLLSPSTFSYWFFIFSPYTLLSPSTAQIIRRYLFLYIPPGFWPRLVARLIAFPKRILPHCIKVGRCLIYRMCDCLLMNIVREIWRVNWRCGLKGSTISGLRWVPLCMLC